MTAEIRRPGAEETGTVRSLWESCFPEDGPQFVEWYFTQVYRKENTLCLFESGGLVSALQMIPYTLKIRGKNVPVATLTGVSTDAASRNRGYARALMADALADMAARDIGLTFLYPFDHGFYERLGWATCGAALEYRIPAEDLPDAMPEGCSARIETDPDISFLSEVYARWSAGRNCFTVRGGKDWAKRIGENNAAGGFAALAEYRRKPSAYALCEAESGEVDAYELAGDSVAAIQAVLAALKPRGLPVHWIAPDDDRTYHLPGRWKDRVKLQPHVMFRVTDVPLAFRQAAPACGGELVLEITGDGMRPENNGVYLIKAWRGKATAKKEEAKSPRPPKPQFSCGIGTLARILMGYMDAQEAVDAGLAQADKFNIDLLARMYPKQRNFLFELY